MSNEASHPPDQGPGQGPGRGAKNFSTEPAVIVLRMEDLTVWMVERVAKMPREHKFTVGDRLVSTCLEITGLLIDATYRKDKLPLLLEAARALTRSRILVRVAQRLHLLSMDHRDYFNQHSVTVGKMLGGWTKAVQAR